jgi:hypothetical protein
MANRRENQNDDRWRSQANNPREWDDRPDYERNRYSQGNQSENYPEPTSRRYPGEQSSWNQGNDPRHEGYSQRGGQYSTHGSQGGGRSYEERFRERPYEGTTEHTGEGGFESHVGEPYRRDSSRSNGATGAGTNWGGDLTRHRPGSLTESATSGERWGGGYAEATDTRYAQRGYPSQPDHTGRGPKGFRRSDDRIHEEVCERLTHDPHVDATDIEVLVSDGIVILSGTVDDRQSKRNAEDLAHEVWGTKDVQNQIRIKGSESKSEAKSQTTTDAGVQQTAGQAGNTGSVLGLSGENAKR